MAQTLKEQIKSLATRLKIHSNKNKKQREEIKGLKADRKRFSGGIVRHPRAPGATPIKAAPSPQENEQRLEHLENQLAQQIIEIADLIRELKFIRDDLNGIAKRLAK